MVYKTVKWELTIRVLLLFFSLIGLALMISSITFERILNYKTYLLFVFLITSIVLLYNIYNFIFKRFSEIDDFFEAIKYRDFSRQYNENLGSSDIKILHKGFNSVNKTILNINKEKEEQHLYLKKILELIHTGIIAYNVESGIVLWVNDAFKKQLSIPSIKNVQFVEKRKPELFNTIFLENHKNESSLNVTIENEKTKLLISTSIFQIEEASFKLIVLQNIEDTLNKNESEAWKKLLSVMTHEIMNSIAPISSLAETLQSKVDDSIKNPSEFPLDIHDLDIGIESIKKRSQGLLKFAKTYRSLNKITKLNLTKIGVEQLFENIKTLMSPSFVEKNIEFDFKTDGTNIEIEIDTYLIEQVLINLILNAVEAVKDIENPKIVIAAKNSIDRKPVIIISDNGKGIPDEIIEDVFIPFFTTKKTGSGIGLSLCKQIMLLHKGKVQIKSIEEKGTHVSLVF